MPYNTRVGVRDGSFESDGVRLHYLDWGGDGPPLILIHATGFLAALWRPIAERLAGRFRVVAVDQRGHGDSDQPADGYRFETFADDLQGEFDALELEAPLAVGHSSGGTIIVAHAGRHPGIVRRAVLIEPILPRPDWYTQPPAGRSAFTLADGARKRRAVWPDRASIFEAYRSREMFQTWREDVLRLYVEEGTRPRKDGQVELKCPPEVEARFFEAVTRYDSWASLPRLLCPTLVLWGAKSHLHGRGLDDQAQQALPAARTVVVPETGHFLPQERPDDVARRIEEFLSD